MRAGPTGGGQLVPAESDQEWYVLVLLGRDPRERPRCFVVPRDHVVAAAWITHEGWLSDPDVPVGSRKDGTVRVWPSDFVRYEERWELLDEPTGSVPVLLPSRFEALLREPRIAFPSWHPWWEAAPSDWPID